MKLTKEQLRILEEDREISEQSCHDRIEALVREAYPKGARLVIRSGRHIQGEVQWFVGEGAPPKEGCDRGSLYSRTDVGALYVCESGVWKVKP